MTEPLDHLGNSLRPQMEVGPLKQNIIIIKKKLKSKASHLEENKRTYFIGNRMSCPSYNVIFLIKAQTVMNIYF